MRIVKVKAFEILDSRGVPTVSTYIELADGSHARADVPSGASTGSTEVIEIRDGDKNRYLGKGVLKAVDIVNHEISNLILNREFSTQREFDEALIELDGTTQKSKLGGNSILSVSMAFLKASTNSYSLPLYEYIAKIYTNDNYDRTYFKLPSPMILMVEGGLHGNWATDIQEYSIVPDRDRYPSFSEKLEACAEVFRGIEKVLKKKRYATTVGFEGAYAPQELKTNAEAFETVIEGIEESGYKPDKDFKFAIDIASSEFFNSQSSLYELKKEKKFLTRSQWLEFQKEWYTKYPIFSIEDPFDEEDWPGWQVLNREVGVKYQIVGDDLLTTNMERIQKAINVQAVNAVLIKPNQIGTVTETLDAIKMSIDAGFEAVISHRGGETNDDLIADLVVGTDATQCKFGGPCRGERLAKYNRLLEIENSLKT